MSLNIQLFIYIHNLCMKTFQYQHQSFPLPIAVPSNYKCSHLALAFYFLAALPGPGYHITAKIERGLMRKELSKKIEFMGEEVRKFSLD